MTKIDVRATREAGKLDPGYVTGVTEDLQRQFSAVHCPVHEVDTTVVATIRKGGAVDIQVYGCCRQVKEAIAFVLSQYH